MTFLESIIIFMSHVLNLKEWHVLDKGQVFFQLLLHVNKVTNRTFLLFLFLYNCVWQGMLFVPKVSKSQLDSLVNSHKIVSSSVKVRCRIKLRVLVLEPNCLVFDPALPLLYKLYTSNLGTIIIISLFISFLIYLHSSCRKQK